MYTSQKCSIHQHNKTIIMRDIRYFINSSFPIQLQASQVHYMKLINENLDSDKTMSLVAEEVLEKFEDKVQDGWVVLVGDGKTLKLHIRGGSRGGSLGSGDPPSKTH